MVNIALAVAAALLPALAWHGAHAQTVYRCMDASGKVQFSDRLCDKTAIDAARVHVRPNSIDASGERELQLRQENIRLREQMRQQGQGGAAAPAVGRSEADLQAEHSNSFECRRAQQNVEAVASSITARTGETRRAAEHRMRAACGMREPTQINVYNEMPRSRTRPRLAPLPFVSGAYTPAAGGYNDNQGRFCARIAGGMQCPDGFVPID